MRLANALSPDCTSAIAGAIEDELSTIHTMSTGSSVVLAFSIAVAHAASRAIAAPPSVAPKFPLVPPSPPEEGGAEAASPSVLGASPGAGSPPPFAAFAQATSAATRHVRGAIAEGRTVDR